MARTMKLYELRRRACSTVIAEVVIVVRRWNTDGSERGLVPTLPISLTSSYGAALKGWNVVTKGVRSKDWCDLILKSFHEIVSDPDRVFDEVEWKITERFERAAKTAKKGRFDVGLCEVDRRADRANERKLGGRWVSYVKRLRMEKGGQDY